MVTCVSPNSVRLKPERLRRAREVAGLTQHQLARVIDVAGGERVSRWELGSSVPHPGVLLKLADALGVEVEDLLEVPEDGPGLRELRLGAGLTLEALAESVLASTRTVHRWEHGSFQRLPSERTVSLLAKALNVSDWQVAAALRASREGEA